MSMNSDWESIELHHCSSRISELSTTLRQVKSDYSVDNLTPIVAF